MAGSLVSVASNILNSLCFICTWNEHTVCVHKARGNQLDAQCLLFLEKQRKKVIPKFITLLPAATGSYMLIMSLDEKDLSFKMYLL